ncbi:MAG: hypothetical protein WC461_03420 [Candidatus Paceibacterota bacterium]|nr:hypothetical protein [Patescibacteria group bacterium]
MLKLYQLLIEAGITHNDIKKLTDFPEMRKRLVGFWKKGGCFEPSSSQKQARKVMKNNFFGIEEAIKYFHVDPTDQQIASLAELPFSVKKLEKVKNKCILLAVFPLSVAEIYDKVGEKYFYNHHFTFTKKSVEQGKAEWVLLRKTPLKNSIGKKFKEQRALILTKEGMAIPSLREMVYAILGHHLATDERIFENVGVRTSDIDENGNHIFVGIYDFEGVRINARRDIEIDYVGITSIQK